MELTERQRIYAPQAVHWEEDGIHLFLDPESPHWVATDARGAQIMGWIGEGLSFGQFIQRYSSVHRVGPAKAWLHVHDFVQSLLRVGFARLKPIVPTPYLGRAAYAHPTGLKELWFHTNNICNLACTHCLVNSAPWVQDWGLPTPEVMRLVDEAVVLGVERFYFTGGEPFMRKDIFELIRTITETRGRELIVLTNATLFKGEKAEEVKRLDRRKVRFQVSIDGASPETNDRIRGKGSFQSAVEGLRFLASLGFQTSITTAVTAANLQDLLGITRLGSELGVATQHLMWLHKRGRIVGRERFPSAEQLIEVVRQVKALAGELGIAVDNVESIKRRVNGRPGVKYDLGNACWDSLCVYSDGTVYPSAAMVNTKPLALGSIKDGGLQKLLEGSPVAGAFRQATVAAKADLRDDPFRYLTGGGDLEHSFWFNLNGESSAAAIAPERMTALLTGPDPYYPLYTAMIQDAMWDLARAARAAVNRRSGYDVPRVLHAMGDGAIHCATDDLAVTGEVDIRTLHSNCVLAFDVDKPRKLVREFYGKAAETPQAELCCPTKFDDLSVSHIPKEVIDRFYGCGSPVTLGALEAGETFVDLGSGAGIDCFIAAKFVGPAGKIIGIDMTDEMLKVADENRPIVAANLGYDVVKFRKGYLEQVPVESKSADLVTSNCVVNLSPDKPKVFSEIWRILRDHGRTVIADIVSALPVPAHLKVNPELWGECIVGALTEEEFLARLEEAGFYGLSILKKVYWKTVEGFDFYSVTVRGYKFEKTVGCLFLGQKAVYLGPMKAVVDEEGHLFPRDVEVEVCTDTVAKLSRPPYAGSFTVLEPAATRVEVTASGLPLKTAECGPGCC
ncbi:MAG: hypothetical protein COV76_08280 [Candidatus Omnitrophica bacterium CG11_big_fil_rev_8_21_14_0_20_64_10]|nr:MAG: hypothetical protein COV76_08280 [Candidatus Omnitrophica bacterium CG11_big_fil_rev_8_21_14_0_20_64_10]